MHASAALIVLLAALMSPAPVLDNTCAGFGEFGEVPSTLTCSGPCDEGCTTQIINVPGWGQSAVCLPPRD
jgi:hypothetical protein